MATPGSPNLVVSRSCTNSQWRRKQFESGGAQNAAQSEKN